MTLDVTVEPLGLPSSASQFCASHPRRSGRRGSSTAPLCLLGAATCRDGDRCPNTAQAGAQGGTLTSLVPPTRHNEILQMLFLPLCFLMKADTSTDRSPPDLPGANTGESRGGITSCLEPAATCLQLAIWVAEKNSGALAHPSAETFRPEAGFCIALPCWGEAHAWISAAAWFVVRNPPNQTSL